ncbi:MAG: hypothetical protein MHM6MM_006078 [Cercozoa sp. M6MM]
MSALGAYTERFSEVTKKSMREQAKFFLNRYVLEFKGNFEEVLDLQVQFSKYKEFDEDTELTPHNSHLFLEALGETRTVRDLRDNLRTIDLDTNGRLALIEYLLFKYGKSVEDLFASSGASAEVIAAFNKAVEEYEAVLAVRAAREKKIEQLRALVAKGGVRGLTAKAELEQMLAQDQLEQNRAEVTSAARKRRAQRAVEQDDGSAAREAALREEQDRLKAEAEAKKKAEEEARAASRARLAARAALFGN